MRQIIFLLQMFSLFLLFKWDIYLLFFERKWKQVKKSDFWF